LSLFLVRRLLAAAVVLFLVTLITFGLVKIVPGDAAVVIAGQDATAEELARVRLTLGLDRPWWEQLAGWYARLFAGDLGQSFTLGRSVGAAILERLPVTLGLALYALTLTIVLGLAAGILAALRQNTWMDAAAMSLALVGVSLPNFWIGIMLIFVFAVELRLFPSGGHVAFLDSPFAMTLPAVSLSLLQMGLLARITRSSMIETLRQDYVRTAVAKGLPPRLVVLKHAFRNVLVPVLTVIGILFSLSVAGAVVIETVYGLPGVGRLVISGIGRRDLPVIQGTLLIVAALCMLVNLAVDMLYAWIDPRVRLD
jgi:peptide/nickel transport system permease protein